jgi:hypothetical protein
MWHSLNVQNEGAISREYPLEKHVGWTVHLGKQCARVGASKAGNLHIGARAFSKEHAGYAGDMCCFLKSVSKPNALGTQIIQQMYIKGTHVLIQFPKHVLK